MKSIKYWHFWIFLLLAVLLLPGLWLSHLPMRFAWSHYLFVYYVSLFVQSVLAAVLLFAIGYPSQLWRMLTEKSGQRANPAEAILSILLPGIYLFFVLVVIFAYNDVIATFRFDGLADVKLNLIDAWLMGGHTVADLSRRTPQWAFAWLENFYFGMYLQVGACLLIVGLREGRQRAFQFAGAIASAYFISLACFYLVPATGPYYLSLTSGDGGYVGIGGGVGQILNQIRNHSSLKIIGTDYFIGFPCMHITQPLLVLWFLRASKRIAAALILYDTLLVLAILLLQEHYVIDVIGGAGLGVIVVVMQIQIDRRRTCEVPRLGTPGLAPEKKLARRLPE